MFVHIMCDVPLKIFEDFKSKLPTKKKSKISYHLTLIRSSVWSPWFCRISYYVTNGPADVEPASLSCFCKKTPRNDAWKCKKSYFSNTCSFRCMNSVFVKVTTKLHNLKARMVEHHTSLVCTNVWITWDSSKFMLGTSF